MYTDMRGLFNDIDILLTSSQRRAVRYVLSSFGRQYDKPSSYTRFHEVDYQLLGKTLRLRIRMGWYRDTLVTSDEPSIVTTTAWFTIGEKGSIRRIHPDGSVMASGIGAVLFKVDSDRRYAD